MRHWSIRTLLFALALFSQAACQDGDGFSIRNAPSKKKVEILFNGRLLTAYCFFDSTEKPILFPLRTISGKTVTRGWPIHPRPGERTDHPHQAGLWFTYENVNGLDFWNNSFAIPVENRHKYGSIRHHKILNAFSGADEARLRTLSHWVDGKDSILMAEETEFVFRVRGTTLLIDRIATLTARTEITFFDVKDGLIGMRVARALEMPSLQEDKFVDAHGNVTVVPSISNEGVTGMYFNRDGIKGDSVWSSQSAWTCLTGAIGNERISIAIIDHPKNPGYPAYWHARGYGLFAANPFGARVFTNGRKEFNFSIRPGQSERFRYRIVIHNGDDVTHQQMETFFNEFSDSY
jgi:hypothetical protein